MPPNPASSTATRRRALFGYGAALALGHVTGVAMANPVGAKVAGQSFVRNEALHNMKKLQKATSRSFKGMRQSLAAAGSRSFKDVRSFAKAGAKSFKGLQRQLSRAGSQTYADLVANIDQAGAAVKSNVGGAAHRVEETLRNRVHDVVGKLGDVSESFEDLQMESVEKVEDAKTKAISELADLIEDAGDAVKFLRWASEMYQTVSAAS
jgi:transglutaminase/protease-like cytokinesis protein 3